MLNEDPILKKLLPYIGVTALAFYLLPLAGRDTGSFILILLVLIPLICLFTAVVFAFRHGLVWWYFLLIGGMFLPSIPLYYNSSAVFYACFFGVIALLGSLAGGYFQKKK